MPQAISYTRFSAAHQGKGSSTERQKQLISTWLAENPTYHLSPLSRDDHGRSGYKGEQLKHGLGSILAAVEEKLIKPGDVLLIEALDRLGRQPPVDMLTVILSILTAGVSIITLEDGKTYSKEASTGDMSDLWILLGKVQQAHDYSARLSTRIKAAYANKRERAKNGLPIRLSTPVWLNTDGSLREQESAAILYCIDRYLKGHGTRRIILEGKEEHPLLEDTHPTTLKRWFKNRALIGEWQDTKPFTAIITHAKFHELQIQLQKRRREMSPEQTYGLSGLVICGNCNSRYYFRRKKNKDDTIIYGNCSTYLKRGDEFCNNNKSMPYEVLDYAFNRTHGSYIWQAAASKSTSKVTERVSQLKLERQDISEEINTLLNVLTAIPNQQETIDKISKLNTKKNNIQLEIYELESGAKSIKPDYNIIQFFQTMDANQELSVRIWEKRLEIMSDMMLLRESLKETGYSLKALGALIIAPDGSKLELKRRSQLHGRYIAQNFHPDNSTSWAAISRKFRAIEDETEEKLNTKLAEPFDPNDKADEMGRFPEDDGYTGNL